MLKKKNSQGADPPTYNIREVPEELRAEDGVPQETIEDVVAHKKTEMVHLIEEFYKKPVTRVKLSVLQKDYEGNKERVALQRLRERYEVAIDKTYLHNVVDPNLAWGTRDHYLDFLVLVSGSIGLHVALPKDPVSNYAFMLDLHQRDRLWGVHDADLGFDPTGRMLYIGTYLEDEIWLAMVPRSFTDRSSDEEADMTSLGGTTKSLSERHYCMVISFLAMQLQRGGFSDIYVRDPYHPALTIEGLEMVTNLL